MLVRPLRSASDSGLTLGKELEERRLSKLGFFRCQAGRAGRCQRIHPND
jgi:hypothetical protein